VAESKTALPIWHRSRIDQKTRRLIDEFAALRFASPRRIPALESLRNTPARHSGAVRPTRTIG
jgi:hypothetical protein